MLHGHKELEVQEINHPHPTQQEERSHSSHKVDCNMCREVGDTDERLWEFREGAELPAGQKGTGI